MGWTENPLPPNTMSILLCDGKSQRGKRASSNGLLHRLERVVFIDVGFRFPLTRLHYDEAPDVAASLAAPARVPQKVKVKAPGFPRTGEATGKSIPGTGLQINFSGDSRVGNEVVAVISPSTGPPAPPLPRADTCMHTFAQCHCW